MDYSKLLREHSVDTNYKELESFYANKVVMITGASGSIGSELCRQLLKLKVKQLILLCRNENNLFSLKES